MTEGNLERVAKLYCKNYYHVLSCIKSRIGMDLNGFKWTGDILFPFENVYFNFDMQRIKSWLIFVIVVDFSEVVTNLMDIRQTQYAN